MHRRLRRHRPPPLVTAAVVVALVSSCARCGEPPPPPPPEPVQVGAEDHVTVERGVIRTGPRISGTLEARERAQVRAEVGGSVVSVSAELGERVAAGETIAQIESESLREAVQSARAAVRSATESLQVARRERERAQALVEGGAIPRRDLENARSRVAEARAALSEAESRLSSATTELENADVTAPIAGAVSERAVSEGDVVSPGALLFVIIDPSTMRLEATVPSTAITQVGVGDTVGFTVRGYPDRTFVGRVTSIAPAANPTTRQVPIVADIPNPARTLTGGLFATGRIAAREATGLVVPWDAIDRETDPPTVAVVRSGEVVRVPVSIGLRDELRELVQVSGDLRAGDPALVRGARDLPPGTDVTLTPPPREAASLR